MFSRLGCAHRLFDAGGFGLFRLWKIIARIPVDRYYPDDMLLSCFLSRVFLDDASRRRTVPKPSLSNAIHNRRENEEEEALFMGVFS